MLDTVIVPTAMGFDRTDAGSGPTPGTVRLKIFFPETMTGDIPFHCHLVDHEDNGMMGVLRVLPGMNSSAARKVEPGVMPLLKHEERQPSQ